MTDLTKVAFEETHDGRRLRIVLRGGRGNIVDSTMAVELLGILRSHARGKHLRAIALEAEGDHFSFGASVPEHSQDRVNGLLAALDGAIMALVHAPVPVIACVRGACLGGGFELVLPCHRIVAAPTAKFGLPEVTLGMFAPAGSALLTERVARGLAIDMMTSGRILTGEEAKAAGLAWFEKNLLSRSASALRYATRAARVSYTGRVDTAMAKLERLFLDETMTTRDAIEGVESFNAKRQPVWVDE